MSLTPAVERLSDALIMGLFRPVYPGHYLKIKINLLTILESGEEATEA